MRRFPAARAGACGAIVMWSAIAGADETRRVTVLGDGPDGDAVARGVASRLNAIYTVGDAKALRAALGPKDTRSIAAAAKNHDRSADLVSKVRAAARKAQADQVIVIHLEKSRTRAALHAWVIDANDTGTAAVDEDVHLTPGVTPDEETDAAWTAVASAFPPPPEPTPPPVAPAPPPAEAPAPIVNEGAAPDAIPAPTTEPTRATSLAVIGVELEGGSRHFSYSDRVTDSLRPYDLFVAPVVKVEGEIYPLQPLRVPVVSGLGLEGSFSKAFALSSQDETGARMDTSWQGFDIGARERIPLGASFILGVDAGYAATSFVFQQTVTTGEQVPTVEYKFLRVGLDGRFMAGGFSVYASGRYLDVLSTGDFGQLFPHASVAGVEAELGISQKVGRSLEASLEVDYTRVFYNLLPQPGDPYVAGGALDEMAAISMGLAYLF
jgi:hypothetical protein